VKAHAPGFEEDDELRSQFIRQLTLEQLDHSWVPDGEHVSQAAVIPKTLVRYWHEANEVPDDVRECLNSWERLGGEGFSLLQFDDATGHAFISDRYGAREVAAFERCRHPAMRSDYFRMCFILAEGGLYVDADDVLVGDGWKELYRDGTLKVQALCYDIRSGQMLSSSRLRRWGLETRGRIFYVNNNPIAAPVGHPVLRRALARATAALLGQEPEPEIQSTTGPGNLTASLAAHAREIHERRGIPDFELLFDWEETARPSWNLAYRADARNWRNMGSARV